jgi:hypothetical protein
MIHRLDRQVLARPWSASIALSLIVLGSGASYLAAELATAGSLGFPLDDGWIHQQFAKHLAEDGQLAFNRGEPSAGSTAPLWSALIAVPRLAGADPVLATKLIGMALSAVAATMTWLLAREISSSPFVAWVAGLAVALSPRLTWAGVSGMEVPLYVALSLGALLAYVRDPDRLAPVWGVLAALSGASRPETFVIFFLLAFHRLTSSAPDARSEALATLRRATAAFAAPVVLYALANVYGSGRPWPSTFTKTEGRGVFGAIATGRIDAVVETALVSPLEALNGFLRFFFEQSAILTMTVVPGALAATRLMGRGHVRGSVVVLVAAVVPALHGAVAPNLPLVQGEGRYIAHALVLTFVLGAWGLGELARQTGRPAVMAVLAAVAVARLASQNAGFADRYALMVDNINRMHVTIGRWVRDETRPDSVVALSAIGAIATVSDRRVVDLEGLVSTDVIPFKYPGGRLLYLERERPDYLIIFPEWYPDLAERTDLFREVRRISFRRVNPAPETMAVYRTPWTR